jgi:plastocyanin
MAGWYWVPGVVAPQAAAQAPTPGKGSGGGSAASIKGAVKLTGKAPERREVIMKSDPFCAKQPAARDEEVVAGPAGQLKNVVVRIAKGAPATPAPADETIVDQNGCMYRPRVVVTQAGQKVAIKNSDQTMHNVHTYRGPSTLFNVAQVYGMPPIKKTFPTVGDVVKFKCDVHPWMTGYVLVTDNPHFAVTGDDGTFTIGKVPPGKYTLEAWHERYGTKTAQITVEADKPVTANFEFAAK